MTTKYIVETPGHKEHGTYRGPKPALKLAKEIATPDYPVTVTMVVISSTYKSQTVIWPEDHPSYKQTWT